MFAKELQVEIQVLARQGKGICEIARLLQCSPKAVRRGKAKDRYGPRAPRPTKLDPYAEYLRERIEHAKPDRLAATVLLREVCDQGYAGGCTQLKALVSSLQPKVQPEPVVRFETEPGKQCQIDFMVPRRRPTKLVAFTASLGYSRYGYAEFADNERVETLIGGLENAFMYLGGTPTAMANTASIPLSWTSLATTASGPSSVIRIALRPKEKSTFSSLRPAVI